MFRDDFYLFSGPINNKMVLYNMCEISSKRRLMLLTTVMRKIANKDQYIALMNTDTHAILKIREHDFELESDKPEIVYFSYRIEYDGYMTGRTLILQVSNIKIEI